MRNNKINIYFVALLEYRYLLDLPEALDEEEKGKWMTNETMCKISPDYKVRSELFMKKG